MTITDPRQPVYIRKGKRYVAFASLDDFGRFDSWHSEGLWLHARNESFTSMTKIADLTDLPSPAVQFAAVMAKHSELMEIINQNKLISRYDLATAILKWISKQ